MSKRFLSALLICFSVSAFAQRGALDYALGLRLGPGTGITMQYFRTDSEVLEGILYTRYRGFTLTGLYEVHQRAFDVRGLKWYLGAGGHVGSYTWYSGHPVWKDRFDGNRVLVGVDGIVGIEYFFGDLPLQVSLDWKPEYQLYGWTGWFADGGAISVRWRI